MQSLYRRYRPDSFESVIGQNHIVKVLKNQILTGEISHAYLFTGTRGTGKTSVAKIFAKAVNCLSPRADGSPCNECEVCRNIFNCYDVLELDAASNNGADAIRGIQESVKYPPTLGRYKVYIIDEVHMLSINAFNALLKTLEEPPKHVVFILATTEIHQLPQTVLSRCMKFDFRLVPSKLIAERIRLIYDEIGQEYDDNAVLQIAEAGDGSVRDALSIADTCSSYARSERLTYNDVLDILGAGNPMIIADLARSILEGDISAAFRIFQGLTDDGKSVRSIMRDISVAFRNIYVTAMVENANSILNLPDELFEKIKLLSGFDPTRILGIIDVFNGLEGKLRYAETPAIIAEAAIARAADIKNSIDINGLITRVKALENQLREIEERGFTANAQSKKPVKTPVKMEKDGALALLLKTSREEKMFILNQALREVRPENLIIKDDSLIIEAKSIGAYNELNKSENRAFMLGMLMTEYIIKNLSILNGATKESLDNAVKEMKRLFNDDILSISNQKIKRI